MSQERSRARLARWGFLCLLAAGCSGAIGQGGAAPTGNGGPGNNGGNNPGSGGAASAGNQGPADIGFLPITRLNRIQYNNTVHDLLGTTRNPADSFPADETSLGFDTIAAVLRVQPEHMEKYLDAAVTLVDELLARPATDAIRQRHLTCDVATGGPSCLKEIVKAFATRAWRAPVQDADVAPYLVLAAKLPTPQDGLADALSAVLVSSRFLYRLETDPDPTSTREHRLTAYEVASRLSYFLWSTMPDDALFGAAASGKLLADDGLRAQLDRMLSDPARAHVLAETFGAEWMGIDRLEVVAPDPMLFPAFNDTVRAAMLEESKAFFWEFLTSKRPISESLGASFTFANAPLAAYYGLPAVTGDAPQRVSTAGTPRSGGLLTLGTYLVGESNPTRTSPVKRGLYVLDRLLCAAPPPPPPGQNINIDQGSGLENLSVRERLAQHQKNGATCAACHVVMDAIGIGLENFDAVGRYRDKDEFGPIDASGQLPSPTGTGTLPFNGVGELSKVLAMDPRLVPCLVQKVLSFGVGRSFDDDTALREQIATNVKTNGASIRAAIDAVVSADVFRSRRAATKVEAMR